MKKKLIFENIQFWHFAGAEIQARTFKSANSKLLAGNLNIQRLTVANLNIQRLTIVNLNIQILTIINLNVQILTIVNLKIQMQSDC